MFNNKIIKEILEWIIIFAIAFGTAFFIKEKIVINAVIPSESMEPTIMTGDRLFGNRLAYINSKPERGDIVIFKVPQGEDIYLIKRVIGLPGEKIVVHGGYVYINGEKYEEPYVIETMLGEYGPVTVPENSYFMMGDNRNHSGDSRFWENPFIPFDYIYGKAGLRYYKDFGVVK